MLRLLMAWGAKFCLLRCSSPDCPYHRASSVGWEGPSLSVQIWPLIMRRSLGSSLCCLCFKPGWHAALQHAVVSVLPTGTIGPCGLSAHAKGSGPGSFGMYAWRGAAHWLCPSTRILLEVDLSRERSLAAFVSACHCGIHCLSFALVRSLLVCALLGRMTFMIPAAGEGDPY